MPKQNLPADDTSASGLFASEAEPVKAVSEASGKSRKAEKAGKAEPAPALPATYEMAVLELEELIARIESGQLPLDQLLSGYQRGAQLLQFCRGKLEAVEQQIRVLDGGELQPWNGEREGKA